jgi:hypothetical protein
MHCAQETISQISAVVDVVLPQHLDIPHLLGAMFSLAAKTERHLMTNMSLDYSAHLNLALRVSYWLGGEY